MAAEESAFFMKSSRPVQLKTMWDTCPAALASQLRSAEAEGVWPRKGSG